MRFTTFFHCTTLGKRFPSGAAYSHFVRNLINICCFISGNCGKTMGGHLYFVDGTDVVQNAQKITRNFGKFVENFFEKNRKKA